MKFYYGWYYRRQSLGHLLLDKDFSKRYKNDGKSEEIVVKSIEEELANYVESVCEPDTWECFSISSNCLFSGLCGGHASDLAFDWKVVD